MAKNMGILVYILLRSPFLLFSANHWNWFWHHSARKGREQMPQRRDGSGEEMKIPRTLRIKGYTLLLFILCEFPHQNSARGMFGDDQVDFPTICQRKWRRKKGNQKRKNTAPEESQFCAWSHSFFSLTRLYPITWIIMQIILSSQLQKARGQGDRWADQMGNPVLRRNRNHATSGPYILPYVSVRTSLNSQGVWCPRNYLGSEMDSPLCCFSMGHLTPRPTETYSKWEGTLYICSWLSNSSLVQMWIFFVNFCLCNVSYLFLRAIFLAALLKGWFFHFHRNL